jgi:hypothetical protein
MKLPPITSTLFPFVDVKQNEKKTCGLHYKHITIAMSDDSTINVL